MNHIAMGALVPWLLMLSWWSYKRARVSVLFFLIMPLLTAAAALWAVAPDLPRLAGMNDLYLELSRDPRMNIFLWHYTIDLYEDHLFWISCRLWSAALTAIVASMPLMALLTLRQEEQ